MAKKSNGKVTTEKATKVEAIVKALSREGGRGHRARGRIRPAAR